MNSRRKKNAVIFCFFLVVYPVLILPVAWSASEGESDFDLRGHGSGVIVDAEGTVLTNAHVIEGAQKVLVQWKDGGGRVGYAEAEVLAIDKEQDLGLVRVRNLRVPPIAFAAVAVRKGVPVFAIGFPGVAEDAIGGTVNDIRNNFVEATVTSGIVSRFVGPYVQHSAIISGGNSGGALVDGCGNLIGVNTGIALQNSQQGDLFEAAGFGYAINASIAYEFARRNGIVPIRSEEFCEQTGVDAIDRADQKVVRVIDLAYRESKGVPGRGKGIFLPVVAIAAVFLALMFTVFRNRKAETVAAGPVFVPPPTSASSNIAWSIDGRTTDGQPVHGRVVESRHTESAPLILGRDVLCDVMVSDSTVSRNHAKLFVSGGQLWCADLGSSNGTRVNGQVCGKASIRVPVGSVLTLGEVVLNVTYASRGVRT